MPRLKRELYTNSIATEFIGSESRGSATAFIA
jgi:hypothetical protein